MFSIGPLCPFGLKELRPCDGFLMMIVPLCDHLALQKSGDHIALSDSLRNPTD
jgi:hypothetical protein